MTILLHACCATCLAWPLNLLRQEDDVVVRYDNPNIHPREEYERRLQECREFTLASGCEFVEAPYAPELWFAAVRGLESEPERGERCAVCFRLRLSRSADYAASRGIPYFATTLTVSPHKKSAVILGIGAELSRPGLTFLPKDFKKKNGFAQTLRIAKEKDFYRQRYCGCAFSLSQPTISAKSALDFFADT
jgi:predicted adenine nucleotide alpha hydrolase (AANH) superfamily ATPase